MPPLKPVVSWPDGSGKGLIFVDGQDLIRWVDFHMNLIWNQYYALFRIYANSHDLEWCVFFFGVFFFNMLLFIPLFDSINFPLTSNFTLPSLSFKVGLNMFLPPTSKPWMRCGRCPGRSLKRSKVVMLKSFLVGKNMWYVGVSKNNGTPKWMVYNGKPY